MSARPGPAGGYHVSDIPTGISSFEFFRFSSAAGQIFPGPPQNEVV
jgi:hypothetical protein